MKWRALPFLSVSWSIQFSEDCVICESCLFPSCRAPPCTIFLAKASQPSWASSVFTPSRKPIPASKTVTMHPPHLEGPHRAGTCTPPIAMIRGLSLSAGFMGSLMGGCGSCGCGWGTRTAVVGGVEHESHVYAAHSLPLVLLKLSFGDTLSGLGGLSLGTSVL